MADFFGISGDFNSYFGTSSGTNSTSSGSSLLGDYNLIRSGAYKKLLKSYYGENKKTTSTGKTELTAEESASKKKLLSAKDSASALAESAAALKDIDTTDRDALAKKVQSFVDDYNSLIDDTSEVDAKSVLRKTLWMIGDAKSSSNVLTDAGITIGKDNKLAVDTDKLKNADTSVLKTLFNGRNSFAGKIADKASQLVNLSNSAVNSVSKGGSSYTNTGDYKKVNTSTLYEELF